MSEKQDLLDRLAEIEEEEAENAVEAFCDDEYAVFQNCINKMSPETRKWFKAIYMRHRQDGSHTRGMWTEVHNGGCIWLYSPSTMNYLPGKCPSSPVFGSRLYYTKPHPRGFRLMDLARCYNDWLKVVHECTKNGDGLDLGKDKGHDEVLIEDLAAPGKCDINAIAEKLEMPSEAVIPALTDLFMALEETLDLIGLGLAYQVVLTS